MNKHFTSLTLAATALLAAGCLPEGFIWWSPDGRTAAVRGSDGLRLADAGGKLSDIVLAGDIQSACWGGDGATLVVSRSLKQTNWAAVEALLPREEAESTTQLAQAIPDLLRAALKATDGSWNDMEKKFGEPLGLTESQALEAAWFCAVSLYREQMSTVIRPFPDAERIEAEVLSSETDGLNVYEITLVTVRERGVVGEPRALRRSLRPLQDPMISPRHPVVAFRAGRGQLKAMTLDGQRSEEVAEADVAIAAWSNDGRSLVYFVAEKSGPVGEIRSRRIVGEGGELLRSLPGVENVASVAVGNSPRLAVLPDGRILFASIPVTLPARTAAIAPSARFYLIDPAQPEAAPVAVPIVEGSLPDDLSTFALSPDGRWVAVVEGGTDAVAVLELATGKVTMISPTHPDCKSRMIPAWRNARELTFAALPSATAQRPELLVWQAGAPARVLSADWAESVVKQWLEGPKTDGQ